MFLVPAHQIHACIHTFSFPTFWTNENLSAVNEKQVASFQKKDKPEAKFVEDTGTKHEAASLAVTEAAQQFLYPDYYKLKSMETWDVVEQ